MGVAGYQVASQRIASCCFDDVFSYLQVRTATTETLAEVWRRAASPKRSLQNNSPSGAAQKCFGSFLLHFHVLDVQGWPHLIPGRTERCPGPRVLVLAAHCAVSALAQPSLLLEDAVGSTVAGWFRWGTWQNQSRNQIYKAPML